MTRFADELRGSEGEWCVVNGRRATVRAVHDSGQKVTVQFDDDNDTAVVGFYSVELLGTEDEFLARQKHA